MSGDLDLEQRYRRVLRLLPGYYRDKWEEDMVAAFLDTWLTGDPDEDSVTMEFDRPGWREVASVAGLAARLYLGGAVAPRRYFAWGEAVRRAVLGARRQPPPSTDSRSPCPPPTCRRWPRSPRRPLTPRAPSPSAPPAGPGFSPSWNRHSRARSS